MSDLQKLTKLITKFRDARDWKQFHNPKDMALSLVLEAAEVMEHFQWKNEDEVEKYIKTNREKVGEELADVFYWILLMSNDLKIDLKSAIEKKMVISNKKYPVNKVKGTHKKYTEL